MSARDTIEAAIAVLLADAEDDMPLPGPGRVADAAIAAIRGMTLEEVAELRPDLAAEFAVARDLADTRGAYILASARARAADGRQVAVRVIVEDVAP